MNFNINSKKIVLFLSLFFLFSMASAQGIVHCGNEGQDPCTFDDFFVLVNSVIRFIVYVLVPPLAVMWFAFGGITMMTAGGDPSKIETGKRMITYGVVGVLVVYGAWIVVYEFVYFLTNGNWTLQFFQP